MSPQIERVAMIAVHTSPLAMPGTGDAGGLNVYVLATAVEMAKRGLEVEVFTRATSGDQGDVHAAPGVVVRHIPAGPFEGLAKEQLPSQLCAFTAGVMQAVAAQPEGYYGVVHSHYWLSGQVGWLAAERWHVPLVHTMHTMARVKNGHLASGDRAEPEVREIGESQVVAVADRLVANTAAEAGELIELYDADPDRVQVVHPGVDLSVFSPGDRGAARAALGVDPEDLVIAFVGRIQPLKAPDLLIAAAADLIRRRADLAGRVRVVINGGPSGTGLERPDALAELAAQLGVADRVRFEPPGPRERLAQWYRAADVVAVPSYSESFGLVALEAQACGTPVVAADVGGLPTAVGGGVLVKGHEVATWSHTLEALLDDVPRRQELGLRGVEHARRFGWDVAAAQLAQVYEQAASSRRLDTAMALARASAQRRRR
ncbi:D-inositol 3-phosphate glycosyltransferase [Austwickia sp. TVS 96-490-7B]|uniref:D-inositol-3-phosphate glycosyltransferase n=1 Tax=Austwickia sp. TVS 96-490-7B TaxID=2830843 RepID=UPI001C56065B|nr:D-inositol-3-phosphate glycosyltransferase [Austwickia sp. TVS 96-490-7B]MBW3083851.1 D-inositol 3-phosphate glycosyltransferase [Austwickia sp. TVS 96-490-7B]